MGDTQQEIAIKYGRAINARMVAGSTLGQAVNQAYTDVNPTDDPKIRKYIIAALVGVDLDTALPRLQHRRAQAQEDSGAV